MAGNNNESNTGCMIVTIIGVIVSLIFTFATMSKDDLAETGGMVMALVGIGGAVFLLKLLFGNNDSSSTTTTSSYTQQSPNKPTNNNSNSTNEGSSSKGCFAAIGAILFVLFVGAIATSSEELNAAVGVLLVVVITVGFGYWFYSSNN